MPNKQTMPSTHVIARNNVTKQSRNMEPVSEIAAVAEFILSTAEGLPPKELTPHDCLRGQSRIYGGESPLTFFAMLGP